jgi:hypothetical protein
VRVGVPKISGFMRLSVICLIEFLIDRIILALAGALQVNIAYSLYLFFCLGSIKVYHTGTFLF